MHFFTIATKAFSKIEINLTWHCDIDNQKEWHSSGVRKSNALANEGFIRGIFFDFEGKITGKSIDEEIAA